MGASLIVCQSQPSSTAISFTVRPSRPTCSVTHRPTRSVITSRGAAIVRPSPVQEPTSHVGDGQHQRCLCHTSRAGRPKHGRSTSSTDGRPLLHAGAAHAEHAGRSTRCSTWTRMGWSSWSSTARTVTSGSPTRRSHMRVALVSTGAPRIERCRDHRFFEPLCRARWTLLHRYTRSSRESRGIGSGLADWVRATASSGSLRFSRATMQGRWLLEIGTRKRQAPCGSARCVRKNRLTFATALSTCAGES
jgi:hypothetical protein